MDLFIRKLFGKKKNDVKFFKNLSHKDPSCWAPNILYDAFVQ